MIIHIPSLDPPVRTSRYLDWLVVDAFFPLPEKLVRHLKMCRWVQKGGVGKVLLMSIVVSEVVVVVEKITPDCCEKSSRIRVFYTRLANVPHCLALPTYFLCHILKLRALVEKIH